MPMIAGFIPFLCHLSSKIWIPVEVPVRQVKGLGGSRFPE